MVGEISTVYFQCYQLAYDLAKKAEKTYRYELVLAPIFFAFFNQFCRFFTGAIGNQSPAPIFNSDDLIAVGRTFIGHGYPSDLNPGLLCHFGQRF